MKTLRTIFFSLTIAFLVILPFTKVVAQGKPDATVTRLPDAKTTKKESSSKTDFDLNIKLDNPLKVSTVQDAVKFFLGVIMKIALPFIVLFFIWSGFNFVLARGNPEKVKEAKNMFFYTIIGTLLILGAWAITNAIIGTVNTITT